MIVSRIETAVGWWKAGYKNQLFFFSFSSMAHLKKGITALEKLQIRTTKMIWSMEHFPYEERLKKKKVGFYTPLFTTL